ncbi:MAG: trehalase family glycosidase [Bacteroidota bacterium]
MTFRNSLFLIAFLSIALACKREQPVTATTLYETELFKDVQLAGLYEDSKTFVDLVPQANFIALEKKYLLEREKEGFDLRAFVTDNFMDKSMRSLEFTTDTTKTMYEHIELMWDKLTRGPDERIENASRIPLPYKYVVPGGRFQEIYYWDSYFTVEGLLAAGRKDLAKGMVDNFAFLLDSIGFIPNGTRDYYETRSQPPFFSLMVKALSTDATDMALYYAPELAAEYAFFMAYDSLSEQYSASKHLVQMGSGYLNRYWDAANTPRPEAYKEDLHLADGLTDSVAKKKLFRDLRSAAESGWDFSSRWYGTPGAFSSTTTTTILPVDLNCLMYHLEQQLEKAARLQGDQEAVDRYKLAQEQRSLLINEYLWNPSEQFYTDYDFEKASPTEVLSLAGAFPLFFGIASREQAEGIKTVLMDKFLKEGGLVTTLVNSGQQWDAPNGWAPLQWIAVKGLLRYGYEAEAREIMERWLALNERVFKNTGKMMEKYNVEDLSLLSGGGEYETQDGFGWTNGVALGFKKILEEMEPK